MKYFSSYSARKNTYFIGFLFFSFINSFSAWGQINPAQNLNTETEECTPCEEARKNNGGEKAVAYLAPVNISPAEKDSITRNKEENNSIRSPEQNQSPFETVKGLREDISKRDAFSKHYINEDGSFTALIGAGPIHYKKDGQWADIDHAITTNNDNNYPFANTSNLMQSYYGSTAHKGIKSSSEAGTVREFLNTQLYWEVNGQATNTISSADVPVSIDNDKAYYHQLFGNISAEFITLTGKRKLNYIIPSAQDLGSVPENAEYLVFTEDVELPTNWTHSITESGVVIKNSLGKEIYLYENPVSIDAVENELEAQGNTVFETSLNGNTLTIKTKVKTEWLLSSERQYPVMVDPTVNVWGNITGTVSWNGTFLNFSGRNGDVVSGIVGTGSGNVLANGFVKYNLSTIPVGSIINSGVSYTRIYANSTYTGNGHMWTSLTVDPETSSASQIWDNQSEGATSTQYWVGIPYTGGTNGTLATQTLNTDAINAIQSSLSQGWFAMRLQIASHGATWDINYAERLELWGQRGTTNTLNSNHRPYLYIDYTEPITDRTLTVSEAYTGGTPANGSHTYTDGTSVTATSGTRPGYTIVGWTGTGSVPATGTGGTASFTITENSSITWIWEQIGTPNNIIFHNYGGADQLAFNNSRINFNLPVFRMSHSAYDATDYEVEINTSPAFGGTSWTQTFTGTYPLNTEANFTFTNGFTPTSGTTYYVRARVRGAANVWSSWTTETYSFTYDTSYSIPNWFQTTQAQFQTDELSGVVANGSHDVVIQSGGGNPIVNGTFANTSGWTVYKTWNNLNIEVSSTDCHNCPSGTTRNLKFSDWGESMSGDFMVVSQQVDLTNIDEITYNANSYYNSGSYPPTTRISSLRFIIGGSSIDEIGTTLHTTQQAFTNNNYQSATTSDQNISVSTVGYTGIHTIKFVVSFTSMGSGRTALINFYVNNVIANVASNGTIISTPIHLASVQGASVYQGLEWNQTLNGGEITFKIQSSADGISGWTDVPGFNNISATGSGVQNYDLSAMTAHDHIRLFGTLNGANATLHDWAILFDEDTPLPVELTHFSTSCETGEPSIRWATASESNNDHFVLERSRNGEEWEEIATIDGQGNTQTTHNYSYTDNISNGVVYYQLRQIDYDGKETIYGPISSSCGKEENTWSIHPIPVVDKATVTINSKNSGNGELVIVDNNGKVILAKDIKIEKGSTIYEVDASRYSKGVYMIYLKGVYGFKPLKFVKF